jgi:hypothetical protein
MPKATNKGKLMCKYNLKSAELKVSCITGKKE